MTAQPVAIVIDGRLVASSTPAILVRGRIYAPVAPYAGELATSITCESGCHYLSLKLKDRSIRVRVKNGRSLLLGASGKGDTSSRAPIRASVRAYGGASIAHAYVPIEEARTSVTDQQQITRYFPVAFAALALGDSLVFDARAATLTIESRPAAVLATPTPYVYRAPQTITQTFTPYSVPTPVPTITGIPRPRRTPILVEPEAPGT